MNLKDLKPKPRKPEAGRVLLANCLVDWGGKETWMDISYIDYDDYYDNDDCDEDDPPPHD